METKNKLVCYLCGMVVELTDVQVRALLDGMILINKAFPDALGTAKTASAINNLFTTINCEHDFEWE